MIRHLRQTLRSETGFTLLETMIAMAIMLVAFASILMVESSSINTSAKARQMNVVGMLARNKMIETEFEIEGKPFNEVKKEETEQFKEPYQDYTWTRTVKELKFPSLNTGGASAANGSNETGGANPAGGVDMITEMITKLMTKYLSGAIREVTVTIKWKRGSGEQSFSVSTYWVDLNHEFEFNQ